jgi:hypothetical protein
LLALKAAVDGYLILQPADSVIYRLIGSSRDSATGGGQVTNRR